MTFPWPFYDLVFDTSRHFSMQVCEKVELKVRTTYNEVADELVAEFAGNPNAMDDGFGDEKGRKSAGSTGGEAVRAKP